MERKGLPNKDFLLAQVFFCKKKKCVDKNLPNFTFTKDINHAIESSNMSFICVPTPTREKGEIELSYIREAAKNMGKALANKDEYHLVVVKGTVVPRNK